MSGTTQPASPGRVARDSRATAYARVPQTPEFAVHRTALVNQLRTHDAPVVLVTAPAGYGKTTLLAQWAGRDSRRFLWARIAAGDEPAELAAVLLAAVGQDHEEAPAGEVAAATKSPRTFVRRLGRRLVLQDEPVVIVLDGVEGLTHPATVELVSMLADTLPPRTKLVLAGRRAPALPFARLRTEGRLLELHGEDLRLSEREAEALLHRLGVDLEATELRDVHGRTEGWPVGLCMCGLALQPSRGRTGRIAESFGGAHHFVAEYIDQEVLTGLTPELAGFATRCAVLDRLNGPLCDSVLGEPGSAARLKELADSQTFVFPLDREHTWFRFHRFLRDALLARLTQGDPKLYAELSARAADWFEQTGDVVTAIRHIRAVGDRDRAADLLGAMTPDLCTKGFVSVEPTLDDLRDESLLSHHPCAAVTGALMHALVGNAAEAERWASAAERADASGPTPDGSQSSQAWVSLMRAALCRDGVDKMRRDAKAALASLAPHSQLVPFALFLLGVAHRLAGDDAAAHTVLSEAVELATSHEATVVSAAALGELSLIAQDEESWSRGESLARSARDQALALEPQGHVFATLALVASARSALRNSNWVRAGDDIERVQHLLPHTNEGMPWLAVRIRLELAGAHLALNDIAAADELVTEIEHLLLKRPHLERADDAARALRRRINALRDVPREASMLTAAELRLLPLLTTHLTFRQIAQHLYVSRNTIKTQAISVYRKLGVSSRTQAIDRAVELGLLKPEGELSVERPA